MTTHKSPKSIILDRGLRPKKSFGQNFMVNDHINATMADATASLGKSFPVLEIGAGTGALTAHLLQRFACVHAVERDRDLVPILGEQFAEAIAQKNLIVHEADGARFDIAKVFGEHPLIMVGNLPYHLTSSILILALKNHTQLRGAVFLVQKEVADRLCAHPKSKEYGFLTAILNLAFRIQKVSKVDRNSFWPVPRVDSAIIKLSTLTPGISASLDIDQFLFFVRGIFQKRRKKLSTILGSSITKEQFEAIGIDPNQRPEELTSEQFLALFEVSRVNIA